MLEDGMQGSRLASSTYLGWDDRCTEFVQLLVVGAGAPSCDHDFAFPSLGSRCRLGALA